MNTRNEDDHGEYWASPVVMTFDVKRVWRWILSFFLLLSISDVLAWTEVGINFRATSGYVTDGTDEIYNLAEDYPTTRGGVTAGWNVKAGDSARDRDSGIDRRLAGINYRPNSGTQSEFQVDLSSSGNYRICLAMGDATSPQAEARIDILDNTTLLFTVGPTGSTTAAEFSDASGVKRSAAAWPGSNVCVDVTFATTTAIFKLGTTDAQSGSSAIAHIYIGPQVAPSPSPSPTPSPTPVSLEIPGMGVAVIDKVTGSCPSGYGQSFDDPARCSLLMPTGMTDRDRDGYTSTDCDDTNPTIFDGIYTTTGCSGGQYRSCTSGTYGSCTSATLCEAGAGGTCYYVNPTTGSNANPGTYASPFHDLRQVSTGYGGVTLVAGDVVYLVGSGTITETALYGGTTQAFYNTGSGSAGNPITLKQYPGSTVVISVNDQFGIYVLYPATHWKLEGMRVTNNDTDKQTIIFNSVRDTELRLNYVYDSMGNGNDNTSGIYHTITWDNAQHESVHIHNNYVKNYRHNGVSSIDNVTGVLIMNADHDGDNADIKVQFNRVWFTDPSTVLSGSCFKRKHGLWLDAAGTDPIQMTDNYCISGKIGVAFGPGLINVSRNFISNTRDTAIYVIGDTTETARNTSITYNTAIGAEGNFTVSRFWGLATDNIIFKNNIYKSTKADYSGTGVNFICWTGECVAPQPDVTTAKNTDVYEVDNNCYYNSVTTPLFAWYPYNGGAAGVSFSAYKTYAGDDDVNSYIEDPVLDTYYRATATNCLDKGWLLMAEMGAGPVIPPDLIPGICQCY